MQTHLTKGGNILAVTATHCAFYDPCGGFIRVVTPQEAAHLQTVCEEITMRPKFLEPMSVDPPTWHFMFTIEDVDDSDYEPGLSSNGGKYTFRTRHFFYTRLNGAKVEFLRLSKSSHCCDFEEDDHGHFCQPVSRVDFIDVQSNDSAATCFYDQSDRETASVQQYGQIVPWESLCDPSTWTDGEEKTEDKEGRDELIFKTAPFFLKRRLVEIKNRKDIDTIGPFTISRILGEKRGSRRA